MGEVYRGTDTNLKRQVAIKVLPASVAGDAERLARFQREAEVLAALNHPKTGSSRERHGVAGSVPQHTCFGGVQTPTYSCVFRPT